MNPYRAPVTSATCSLGSSGGATCSMTTPSRSLSAWLGELVDHQLLGCRLGRLDQPISKVPNAPSLGLRGLASRDPKLFHMKKVDPSGKDDRVSGMRCVWRNRRDTALPSVRRFHLYGVHTGLDKHGPRQHRRGHDL